MVDIGQLDYILKNVVNTIKQSQEQINYINEEALKEWNELQQRLVDIQCQIRVIIDEVDSLDKQLRRSRQRLAEVSRNFQIFSEEDIKAAYDETTELQLKLALKRQLQPLL
jgi:two-component system sensor histidine kinase DegS